MCVHVCGCVCVCACVCVCVCVCEGKRMFVGAYFRPSPVSTVHKNSIDIPPKSPPYKDGAKRKRQISEHSPLVLSPFDGNY